MCVFRRCEEILCFQEGPRVISRHDSPRLERLAPKKPHILGFAQVTSRMLACTCRIQLHIAKIHCRRRSSNTMGHCSVTNFCWTATKTSLPPTLSRTESSFGIYLPPICHRNTATMKSLSSAAATSINRHFHAQSSPTRGLHDLNLAAGFSQ